LKIQPLLSVVLLVSISGTGVIRAQTGAWNDSLLAKIRAAATFVPGAPPRAVRVLRFGGADLNQAEFLDGGGNERWRGTLSVFQIRFTDGWIMVDAGIDKETAAQPSSGAAHMTIPQDKYDQIQRALVGARSIVVTHEHDDHVAGVIRNPAREIIAPKTLLTRAQVQTLIEHPNNPVIRLDASWSDRYCVIDYDLLYPLAAGVVLVKAPGHTPGSQMIYVRLASGKEILLIGDIVWVMAGVEQRRQKPDTVSKELGEDRAAIQQEIEWLHSVTAKINLVNSHDDASIAALIREGILKEGLDFQLP
jgi:glyoxylase-like metal-dependent hydrolase (beta-lactamase superfamily II)